MKPNSFHTVLKWNGCTTKCNNISYIRTVTIDKNICYVVYWHHFPLCTDLCVFVKVNQNTTDSLPIKPDILPCFFRFRLFFQRNKETSQRIKLKPILSTFTQNTLLTQTYTSCEKDIETKNNIAFHFFSPSRIGRFFLYNTGCKERQNLWMLFQIYITSCHSLYRISDAAISERCNKFLAWIV